MCQIADVEANTRADLGRLEVQKLIVHDVPRRLARAGSREPILSEVESPLSKELKNYFRERITIALLHAGYDVVFDADSGSPVPGVVLGILDGRENDFVSASQKAAQHLFQCQTGVNPAGLLCVAEVSLAKLKGLAVLKLEREAGLRLYQTRVAGKATFNLEHLRDLMLTEKTKVFKVGLFLQEGQGLDAIVGAVSDNQRGYHPTTEVADFFLKKFLGCKLREAPAVTTKRVFQASEAFIQENVMEPEIKARYEIALLSELASEANTFSPRRFAERHLRLDDRQNYIDALSKSDIQPQPFDKDASLIRAHLTRIQLEFASGIAVLGDPKTFERHVVMKPLEDGRTRVEIEDQLKRVQGKR